MALALRSCRNLDQALGSLGSPPLLDIAWAYWQFSIDHPGEFRVILETRQLMLTDRVLPNRDEWRASDAFGMKFASLDDVAREAFAAAVGYVEFHFRHRAAWQGLGLTGKPEAVRTVLERIFGGDNR